MRSRRNPLPVRAFQAYDLWHHATLILWTVLACQERERAASGR